VHPDGLATQVYAASVSRDQSLRRTSRRAKHVLRALRGQAVYAKSAHLALSLIRPESAVRYVLLALLAVVAHAALAWMGRSPTIWLNRLPVCSVCLVQLVRVAHVQTAAPVLPPIPTARIATSAQLIATAHLELRVRRALTLSMGLAHHLDALPTTSSTVTCVLTALNQAVCTTAAKRAPLALQAAKVCVSHASTR